MAPKTESLSSAAASLFTPFGSGQAKLAALSLSYVESCARYSVRTWKLFLHREVVLPEARTAEVVEAFCPQTLVRSILQQAR